MKRPISNREIADILREIGLMLEVEDVAFKPQAYAAAANTIMALDQDLATLDKTCGTTCLDALPAIGEHIAEKIDELVTTGHLHSYEELKRKYPMDLLALTSVQDIGAKTAVELYRALKIKTIKDLRNAAEAGKIATLPGFGQKTQERILEGLAFLKKSTGRWLIHQALPLARRISDHLSHIQGVTHCDIAGSIRRRKETIGDIDLVITAKNPDIVARAIRAFPEVISVREEGPTMITVRYASGLNGDIRLLKPNQYGSALMHFTGSREHNILLRERAVKRGWKLSEYGLFAGEKLIAGRTEAEIYKKLDLAFIPPEMREAQGEIEAAEARHLPDLVGYDEIKGDLQVQTNWTDGSDSIESMARAAKTAGLSYMAVTDHTKSLTVANGLTEARLEKQRNEIETLNKKLRGFRVFASTECDILKEGTLDLSDRALEVLDFVCVSVHSHFNLSETEMTERVIRAMKHPAVNILFHPTGRIVNEREAYRIDMGKVIRAAVHYGVALEVNASARLDLNDVHIHQAIDAGAKLVIDSDTHAPVDFKNLEYGIAQARRGWATKADILNTKPAAAFLKALKGLKKHTK